MENKSYCTRQLLQSCHNYCLQLLQLHPATAITILPATHTKKWKLCIRIYTCIPTGTCVYIHNWSTHTHRDYLLGEEWAPVTMLIKSVINCTMMLPLTYLTPTEPCNHILVKTCIQYPGWLQIHKLISFHLSALNLVSLPSKLFKVTQFLKYMQDNCQILYLIINQLPIWYLQLKKCFVLL